MQTTYPRSKTDDAPPTNGDHLKHGFPGYHTINNPPPRGAVAYCGYVLNREVCPGAWGRSDACVVCESLAHSTLKA
jgi:hypothetical protein